MATGTVLVRGAGAGAAALGGRLRAGDAQARCALVVAAAGLAERAFFAEIASSEEEDREGGNYGSHGIRV